MDDRRQRSGHRFVLMRHELPPEAGRCSHWDFMLESHGKLLTWELPTLAPSPLPATFQELGIRRLPDHRLDYLDYQGPVSGNRGSVARVDSGFFEFQAASDECILVSVTGVAYEIELQLPRGFFFASSSKSNQPEIPFSPDNAKTHSGSLLKFELRDND